MTYTTGSLIEATDYNGFAANNSNANVNDVWGVGSGDKGYGQPTTLSTVSVGGTVSASSWADLNNRITSLGNHTNTSITSRTNPTTGDVIAILNNLNTDLTNVTTNRGNAASSGTTSSTWTGNTAKTSATGSSNSPWTITFTHTVTFASANQARYFWNAGGLVRLDMNKSSTGTDTDDDWNTFIGTIGTLYVSGRVNNASQTIAGTSYTGFTRVGGSGTPSVYASTTGWYTLAGGDPATTLFNLADNLVYSGNYVQVTGAVNAGRTVLTLTTTWVSAGTTLPQTADISGGTDTTSPYSAFGTAPAVLCRFVPPETTYLTNTWGTPAIAASVA
jgi:hypothetical protein